MTNSPFSVGVSAERLNHRKPRSRIVSPTPKGSNVPGLICCSLGRSGGWSSRRPTTRTESAPISDRLVTGLSGIGAQPARTRKAAATSAAGRAAMRQVIGPSLAKLREALLDHRDLPLVFGVIVLQDRENLGQELALGGRLGPLHPEFVLLEPPGGDVDIFIGAHEVDAGLVDLDRRLVAAARAEIVGVVGVAEETGIAAEPLHLVGSRLDADMQEQAFMPRNQVTGVLAVIKLDVDPAQARGRVRHVDIAVDQGKALILRVDGIRRAPRDEKGQKAKERCQSTPGHGGSTLRCRTISGSRQKLR